MKKLVIGCGYLGRRVACEWLARGDEVFALTRRDDNAHVLRSLGIVPIIGDVTDAKTLSELPSVDTVLYAVGYDRQSPHSYREVYVDGLANVLNAVDSQTKHFIYISSTSVYGQTGGEWIDETSPCLPTRPNGQVCLEAEQLIRDHFSEIDDRPRCEFNILRLAGIYGPDRLLQRVEALRSGKPLPGNPQAYLNLIHVDDAVQAIHACETHGSAGETYLVSDDKPIQRGEYYETLASLVKAPLPHYEEQNEDMASQFNKRCSNRKLHDELGVELIYPTIETGLLQAVDFGD